MKLFAGERLDKLFSCGYQIIQHEEEFAFSLDALLLAHFAKMARNCQAIDLGTGTGVIALLLAARGAQAVTGLEVNTRMVGLAKRSVDLNNLGNKICILEADYRYPRQLLPRLQAGSADLVVANPPYRVVGTGVQNAKQSVASARHELSAVLADVIAAAAFWAKYRGRFAMVHLPERMTEILVLMSQNGLEPKRLRLVYPAIDKPANMLLVEGIRGGKVGLEVLSPLIVHNSDGSYSDEIKRLYFGP
jgi:tRNA1Val (adenine37-N6)-methyltransferase